MTTTASPHLALLHYTSLIDQSLALVAQPELSKADHTWLQQLLQNLQTLDKTIQDNLKQHLGTLFETDMAFSLLLQLLEERESPNISAEALRCLLLPLQERLHAASREIGAMC